MPSAGALEMSGHPGSSSVLHDVLRSLVLPKESKDGWQLLGRQEEKDDPVVKLRLLHSIFKADTPFRTILATTTTITASSGTVNSQIPVANIGTTAEWTSVDALFDEVFVHQMDLIYEPYNQALTTGSGTVAAVSTVNTTSAANTIQAAGLIAISLFGSIGYYSTAVGMSNNPTAKYGNSARPFRYSWRNNVRFDPHGISIGSATSLSGWQGWMTVTNVTTQYGGAAQIRALGDPSFNGGTTVVLGQLHVRYHASFRSRA